MSNKSQNLLNEISKLVGSQKRDNGGQVKSSVEGIRFMRPSSPKEIPTDKDKSNK